MIRGADEPFKLELLHAIKDSTVTLYGMEAPTMPNDRAFGFLWWDLCAGPHLESTGQLNPRAIELQSVAGAYWRGDETRPMLQV